MIFVVSLALMFLEVSFGTQNIGGNFLMPHPIKSLYFWHRDRIINGQAANRHDFPYQVGIEISVPTGWTWCGGSIISQQYVLTAAHCIDSATYVYLILGAHDRLNPAEPGQVRIPAIGKSSFTIHTDWNVKTLRNDIALIRLPSQLRFNFDTDADADEEEGHIENCGEKDINKDKDRLDEETAFTDEKGSPEPPNGEISISLVRAKNLSLLQSQEISSSQQNFFRMLDQKIDDGPDYDSNSETEIALEEARLNALVQHWESASLTASLCSSASRSLQTTPVRQVPMRQQPLRPVANSIPQQPLSVEFLSHNQQQQQQILQQSPSGLVAAQIMQSQNSVQQPLLATVVVESPQSQMLGKSNLSPKRGGENRTLLSQSVIHQSYGVAQQVMQPPPPGRQRSMGAIPPHMQIAYYNQPPPQSYFGEVLHPMQVPQATPEYRFPPAISVQRLAPQVQRQIRETQELIKDSCPQLYAAGYGSPGPPLRAQPRTTPRRPTLETQYSQELS